MALLAAAFAALAAELAAFAAVTAGWLNSEIGTETASLPRMAGSDTTPVSESATGSSSVPIDSARIALISSVFSACVSAIGL